MAENPGNNNVRPMDNWNRITVNFQRGGLATVIDWKSRTAIEVACAEANDNIEEANAPGPHYVANVPQEEAAEIVYGPLTEFDSAMEALKTIEKEKIFSTEANDVAEVAAAFRALELAFQGRFGPQGAEGPPPAEPIPMANFAALEEPVLGCRVCFDRPRNMIFFPCHHVVACEQCATDLYDNYNPCIVCRRPLQSLHKCFF